jgi:hypothetical protein
MRYAASVRRIALELQDGPGGWVEAVLSMGPEFGSFYVRLQRTEHGEWTPQGTLYVAGLPESLRDLPLHRVLLAVAASESLHAALARRLDEEVPEPGSHEFEAAFTSWVHDEPPLVLERPKGRALPDDFFTKVAETYRTAMMRGLPPRTAVAEAAGVSTDVAGRWVREARRRKFLPETQPGKVKA